MHGPPLAPGVPPPPRRRVWPIRAVWDSGPGDGEWRQGGVRIGGGGGRILLGRARGAARHSALLARTDVRVCAGACKGNVCAFARAPAVFVCAPAAFVRACVRACVAFNRGGEEIGVVLAVAEGVEAPQQHLA
jgi:hypothetical protein